MNVFYSSFKQAIPKKRIKGFVFKGDSWCRFLPGTETLKLLGLTFLFIMLVSSQIQLRQEWGGVPFLFFFFPLIKSQHHHLPGPLGVPWAASLLSTTDSFVKQRKN